MHAFATFRPASLALVSRQPQHVVHRNRLGQVDGELPVEGHPLAENVEPSPQRALRVTGRKGGVPSVAEHGDHLPFGIARRRQRVDGHPARRSVGQRVQLVVEVQVRVEEWE